MTSFLTPAPTTPEAEALYDSDLSGQGFVMNLSRVWAHLPALKEGFVGLIGEAGDAGALTLRERGVLITACASALGDSYCSLAWGGKLAGEASAEVAAGVLTGDDGPLTGADRALAAWARQVTRDPNGVTAADVQVLRDAGYDDAKVLAITAFIALRAAFATVNDALGARPDPELLDRAPQLVREAVTWGRPVA